MRILDYSAWINRTRKSPKGLNYLDQPPLIMKEGWCRYCRRQGDIALQEQRVIDISGHTRESGEYGNQLRRDLPLFTLTVWECRTCGWWDLKLDLGDSDEQFGDVVEVSLRAVLKSYDLGDSGVPLQALRQELALRAEMIYEIHQKKMEELVASILRDFYVGCEVTVCGKTPDGGIDLIMVLADSPFAVQVKRRTKPDSVEPVEMVRAFLGASLLKGFDHLLYVTSADHFTGGPYGALTAAENAVRRKLVNQFHLVDRHRFFDMLHLVTNTNRRNWAKALPFPFSDLNKV